MEQSGGGQITAKLAKPADGSEDRLSALPDELLVLILECLDTTAEAARTSVLARRWGGLLPVLSKLRFQLRPDDDGNRIRELLGVTDAPKIRYISVTTRGATADSAMAWLPAAAGRLFGGLVYHNMVPDMKNHDAVEMARRGGTVQLPCFENATSIELRLQFLGLALPSLGVFTRLTDLCLRCLKFPGPCELGDLLSSPRCPCLQKLSISFSELGNLSINSESLLQMNLMFCDLRQLTIVTPLLQKLSVHGCFVPAIAGDDQSEQQGANITAPLMVSLVWMDQYDPRYFHLGQPQQLQTGFFYLYGPQTDRERNHSCLNLLQQFKVLDSLHLQLVYFYYKQDICHYQYLLGDMTALPRIMFLHLDLYNRGHSFGASLFHVLRMCTGLQRLSLVLHGRQHRSNLEVEPAACPSGCVCDQPNNWKTDELVLDHLEDAHIIGLRGAEHEVALVQRFLGWATVLKSLRITLVNEMTEAEIGEFRQALEGSFRSETWVQFDTSDSKRSEHSIVPKDQSLPCRCDSEALIPTNRDGLIEYRAHPFWRQKYCPSHEDDGTPRCCSCERMEPREFKYITSDDGRKLCLEYLTSSIMDTPECQQLNMDIQDFFEGLNMKVEQQIPLLLVERQALNEALEAEKKGHHLLPNETRDLCLSTEKIVRTFFKILKVPKIELENQMIDMIVEPYKLSGGCEVTAILILYGLPRLLTGCILAHELMHPYLCLKGFQNLSIEVEDGICQILSHLWLESEIITGSSCNVSSSSEASSSSPSSVSTSSKKGAKTEFEKKLG